MLEFFDQLLVLDHLYFLLQFDIIESGNRREALRLKPLTLQYFQKPQYQIDELLFLVHRILKLLSIVLNHNHDAVLLILHQILLL